MDIKATKKLLTKMTNEHISKFLIQVPVAKQEQYVVEMQILLRESLRSIDASVASERKEKLLLAEKINKLNNLCEGTLSITSYVKWSIYSYGEDTILCVERFPNGICASTFETCVDKAYKIATETKK